MIMQDTRGQSSVQVSCMCGERCAHALCGERLCGERCAHALCGERLCRERCAHALCGERLCGERCAHALMHAERILDDVYVCAHTCGICVCVACGSDSAGVTLH
jgi:hypothetical protein